jgi:hypothetical protein
MLHDFGDQIKIIKIELIEEFYRPHLAEQVLDQTGAPVSEC